MSDRLYTSEVARRLLDALAVRGGEARDSISLDRNARGVTQISVKVYANEGETFADYAARCRGYYDGLRAAYPMPDGTVGAEADANPGPFS